MTYTRRATLKLFGATTTASLMPLVALAQTNETPEIKPVTHEVMMLTKDPENKKNRNLFSPDLLHINPGDTVRFIATDKGHNAASDKKMLPEGAEPWKGKINKDVEVTFTVEGTYGYFCTPHRTLGMVGLVLVGDPSSNYEAAKALKQKSKAKKRYLDIFERADAIIGETN